METPNKNYIKQLAGDDLEFEQQFINILKEEFPVERNEYQKTLQNKEYQETAQLVHKIKHKFNILGLEESYQLAQDYEAELLKSKTDMQTKFEASLNLVEEYIQTI
ncbi:Hpt domain-containing protein [Euzebyella saccharophila]|uniref:Hpt domain-containing protein n=1 Tax=Euzebyella saccharophila TaxID=679664 RepID=A0ABV8JL28_9FLAO|nr:Hpt domain-containing protein [Euzebyella saccharophila]